MDEFSREKRRHIESVFENHEPIPGTHEVVTSPSGRYQLAIDCYQTGPNTWEYSRGIVTRLEDTKVIADVKRNYGHFPYGWVQHANGNEYLVCGEDYQGYSVINLTQEQIRVYLPEAAARGGGFCWVVHYPSPDSLVLAVEGCYWAWPYEVVFYDFSDPDTLPLAELARMDAEDETIGWEDNETFAIKRERKIRKSDGQDYYSLPSAEQDGLDTDESQLLREYEFVRWKRTENRIISSRAD